MSYTTEIWKDVENYEGLYQISSHGRIKGHMGKIRTPGSNKKGRMGGYLLASLSRNGKSKTHYIHRLVAIHFIPNPDKFIVVNHLDGNDTNNKIENLQWCSHSENMRHMYRIGLRQRKIKNILLVKSLYSKGKTQREIATKLGVNQSTISVVLIGRKSRK